MYLFSYICTYGGKRKYPENIYVRRISGVLRKVAEPRKKYDYVMRIAQTERVLSAKFVKHLNGTDLHEMRVSVGTNEYRTILFAADNRNASLATKLFLLNSFLKKSEKDYKKQTEKAEKLINKYSHEED